MTAWRTLSFDDSAWAAGPTPTGYSGYGDPVNSADCWADVRLSVVRYPLSVAEDADGDGLPDAWEQARFTDTVRGADGDEDEDGLSNYAEWIAGTGPLDEGSLFAVHVERGPTGMVVSFQTQAITGAGVAGIVGVNEDIVRNRKSTHASP